MNGWILLHKKIWENELFQGNPYAFTVWVWLLCHANENGEVKCGRNQIAKDTGVKSETVRYWLTRFLRENYQLTTIKTTNKYSVFLICNWKEYQRKTTSTSTQVLQENYQPPTTNKEIKNKRNKELVSTNTVPSGTDTELLELWFEITCVRIRMNIPQNCTDASWLDRTLGREDLKSAIETTRLIKADRYAPRALQAAVSNYIGLRKNLERVESYRQSLNDTTSFHQKINPITPKVTTL